MITIQDIAAHIGMSPATVSKVVNRRPDVGADTIRVVENAIAELGYKPRRRGRPAGRRGNGNGRRTNRIALLAPGIPRAQMNSPVYMDLLHGVEGAVRDAEKSFLLTHLPPNSPCPPQIFPQKVDGVILFGPTGNKRLATKLRSMPCVQVMGKIEREGWWDHVSYNNSRLGEIAAKYLLDRGHRQVVFISSMEKDFFLERGNALKRALQAAGGDSMEFVDESLEDESGSFIRIVPEGLQKVFDQIMAAIDNQASRTAHPELGIRNSGSPTAIFLAADTLAPAVCAELQRRGLTAGEDVDLISCNNEQMLLNHVHPRPATIDIHAEQVGRKAVEQLLWRIDHPTEPRVTIALEPTLVSASPAPKSMQNCELQEA